MVAFARGGVLETVEENVDRTFFREQTEKALLAAIEEAAGRRWDPAAIRRHAERFSPQVFLDGMAREIQHVLSV